MSYVWTAFTADGDPISPVDLSPHCLTGIDKDQLSLEASFFSSNIPKSNESFVLGLQAVNGNGATGKLILSTET